jgi:hypothetical protein
MILIDLGKFGKAMLHKLTVLELVALIALLGFGLAAFLASRL